MSERTEKPLPPTSPPSAALDAPLGGPAQTRPVTQELQQCSESANLTDPAGTGTRGFTGSNMADVSTPNRSDAPAALSVGGGDSASQSREAAGGDGTDDGISDAEIEESIDLIRRAEKLQQPQPVATPPARRPISELTNGSLADRMEQGIELAERAGELADEVGKLREELKSSQDEARRLRTKLFELAAPLLSASDAAAASQQAAPVAADGAPDGAEEAIEQALDGGWKVVVKPNDLSIINADGQAVARYRNATLALAALASALQESTKLQAFKTWVHDYLDTHGVPHHPPGSHGAAGCRIGDRMDWLMAKLASAAAGAAGAKTGLRNFDFGWKIDDTPGDLKVIDPGGVPMLRVPTVSQALCNHAATLMHAGDLAKRLAAAESRALDAEALRAERDEWERKAKEVGVAYADLLLSHPGMIEAIAKCREFSPQKIAHQVWRDFGNRPIRSAIGTEWAELQDRIAREVANVMPPVEVLTAASRHAPAAARAALGGGAPA